MWSLPSREKDPRPTPLDAASLSRGMFWMFSMYTWEHIPGGLHVPSPGYNGQYGGGGLSSGSEYVGCQVPSPLGFRLLACPLEWTIVHE